MSYISEPCIAPGIEHEFEFQVAEFGAQIFRCKLCGLPQDVLEDSNP